jgi:hypothetical protein
MDTAVPDTVTRYFEADARRDVDATLALFTDDAEVVDEGRTWRGAEEIRTWREGPASRYEYTVEVIGAEPIADGVLVTGHLEGDFPGGTADLTWRFTLDDDRVRRLEIAP